MAIGVYATAILFVKIVLAVMHQLKWLLFERCCRRIRYDKVRVDNLRAFWKESYQTYASTVPENK